MNNFAKTALILSVILLASNANAGVRFLVDSSTHTHRDALKADGGLKIKRMCNNRGYSKTECKKNEVALEFCPQDSSYFKYCCPEGFSSTKEECYEANMEPSARSCHGYHHCETLEIQEKEDSDYYYNESYYEEDISEGYLERRQQVHPIVRTQQIR